MTRLELHKTFSRYFPNSKHYLFEIFEVSDDEILEKAKNLKGYKIPIKFSDRDLRVRIMKLGLNETTFYNAFLEVMVERYKSTEEIGQEIERWRKNILQFV